MEPPANHARQSKRASAQQNQSAGFRSACQIEASEIEGLGNSGLMVRGDSESSERRVSDDAEPSAIRHEGCLSRPSNTSIDHIATDVLYMLGPDRYETNCEGQTLSPATRGEVPITAEGLHVFTGNPPSSGLGEGVGDTVSPHLLIR